MNWKRIDRELPKEDFIEELLIRFEYVFDEVLNERCFEYELAQFVRKNGKMQFLTQSQSIFNKEKEGFVDKDSFMQECKMTHWLRLEEPKDIETIYVVEKDH